MEKRVPTQIHTRKLDRLVAHVNMAKRKLALFWSNFSYAVNNPIFPACIRSSNSIPK